MKLVLVIIIIIVVVTVMALAVIKNNKSVYLDVQEVYADDLEEMERIWLDLMEDYTVVREIHVHKGRFRILVVKKSNKDSSQRAV